MHAATTVETNVYTWAPAGHNVEVAVRHEVVAELRSRLAGLTGESPEIGGLLLGRVDPRADGAFAVSIDGLVPVSCEYRYGQTFVLSPRDRQRLDGMLARMDRRPVGCFRSHARRGLYLDEKDFSFFQLYFPQPEAVFLLARQADPDATAGFFFWEENDVHRHAPYLEFSLRDAAPETVVPPPPELSPIGSPPAARHFRTAALAALLVATPVASFEIARALAGSAEPKPAPSPAAAAFSLHVRQTGALLDLTWNARDPLVRKADHAHLTITDGPSVRQVWLDARRLAAGSYTYLPTSHSIDFQMELYSMLRRQRLGAAVEGVDTSAEDGGAQRGPDRGILPPEPAAPKRFAARRRAAAFVPSVSAAVSRRIASARTSVTLADPPPLPAAPPQSITPPPLPAAVALPPPEVRATVTAEEPPRSLLHTAIDRVPGLRAIRHIRAKDGQGFVPARPPAGAGPVLPPGMTLGHAREIDILARIDKNGRATELEYPAGSRLGDFVAGAIRKWQFTPALWNNAPVPSELVLHFRFPGASSQPAN